MIGPAEEIEFCNNQVTHIIPTTYVNHNVSIISPCFIYCIIYVFGFVKAYCELMNEWMSKQSMMMHFISYGGKGKLIALVSEEVVPDPQQLCSDCADALQKMKEATHK